VELLTDLVRSSSTYGFASPNHTKNLAGGIQSGTNAGKNERSPEACKHAGFRAGRLRSFDTIIGSDVLADTSENRF